MIRLNRSILSNLIQNNVQELISVIYPADCLSCNKNTSNSFVAICDDCWNNIQVIKKPYCHICGYPVTFDDNKFKKKPYVCVDCMLHKKWFDKATAASFYKDRLRELIHQLKFNGFQNITKPLANLLLQKYLYDEYFGGEDLIIPVPLHRSRIRERGFNQAELLARKLSRFISIPVDSHSIKRVKNTKPLYKMPQDEREKILKNAFSVVKGDKIKKSTVLLIDDIYTTGTTVNEVSRTLKKSGAAKINVLTVSRALAF